MSVSVQHLSKIYGEQHAVDDISFDVPAGQIVGFLGPNGAGKSTTMKILTCFIPPSSGEAKVCGFDSMKDPLEVKRRVGYLPEHNPLYPDMYVKEYLEFAARMHNMKGFDKRVEEMIEVTGLSPERKKKIGQLSKGYRQRVGLAQAMLHNPEVLILDEPTSGLDPNQLADIRGLIKTLGKEKTVILSTHIMQEVQALCDRVIIINKGRIVADDSVEGLRARQAGATIVKVSFKESPDAALFKKIKGVADVKRMDDHQFLIQYMGSSDIRETLFKFAVEQNLTLLNLQLEQQSLEDVFRQLTGR
jgi:ABC-2 type transport system ATP-binding protein